MAIKGGTKKTNKKNRWEESGVGGGNGGENSSFLESFEKIVPLNPSCLSVGQRHYIHYLTYSW